MVIIIKMMNQSGQVFKLKIIMTGNGSSGISSLSLRYVENLFHEDYIPTIGVDFRIKTLQPLGAKLYIWETRGGERFRAITRSYYRGAHGIIIAYNITDRDSFMSVPRWIEEVQNSQEAMHTSPPLKVIVGTHLDQSDRRAVTQSQGLQMAQRYNCRFYEASARNDVNVKEVFQNLTLDILGQLGYSKQRNLQKLRQPLKLWRPGTVQRSCC